LSALAIRDETMALILTDPGSLRALGKAAAHAVFAEWLRNPPRGPGSNRIACAKYSGEPLSMEAGEITGRGSINQAAVRKHRAATIDEL
jgi:feruloyl-CoA synthase